MEALTYISIMADVTHNYTKLPAKLRNELLISKAVYEGGRKSQSGPGRRKEQRKAARLQKKTRNAPALRTAAIPCTLAKPKETERNVFSIEKRHTKAGPVSSNAPKSILKGPKVLPIPSPLESPPQNVTRRLNKDLIQDDAEIAALERALGVKNKSKLPKKFEEDGLDDLLEGLEDNVSAVEAHLGKRKPSASDEWLRAKRRKLQDAVEDAEDSNKEEAIAQDDGEDEFDTLSESKPGKEDDTSFPSDLWCEDNTSDGLDEEPELDESKEDVYVAEPIKAARPLRENPYVAPVAVSTVVASGKYIPPKLRNKDLTEQEDLSRLRRQVQGLLNRLSEVNMLSIVGDVKDLYQTNPRQHVSSTLLEVLLGLLSDPSSLQDTFIILHAGFIATLHKIVGNDFGAQAVQRIGKELLRHYETHSDGGLPDKRLVNLISLLAEVYNLQMIGSVLMYDLIRLFLDELSEVNTELLLKIMRTAGSQLRQDDPLSLKAIVQSLQDQITKAGEEAISIKIRFMMETMNSIKSNRMKTGVAASTISSEHSLRMKKTLGKLNQNHVTASEPLRISLNDLRESERRGKWWLVGSSFKDDNQEAGIQEGNISKDCDDNVKDTIFEGDAVGDLVQLAKRQRMNTSIRQSIFIAIMSATDCNDAYLRLIKLHLKKSQELEIPKVLLHCSGTEMGYNPFYTLLARKLCADRKLRMAFQFSLWDIFKQLDEGDEGFDDEDESQEGKLGLRATLNLARMFGNLIADNGLGLGVLKNLNLAYMQPRIQIFVEILVIALILRSQNDVPGARNEAAIIDIFTKPKDIVEMGDGLRYFLKKSVSKSDFAGNKHDREVVRWGCKVASSALKELKSKTIYDV